VRVRVLCALMALPAAGFLFGANPAAAQAAAGSLDPGFGSGGKVLSSLNGQMPGAAVLQPNGDLLVSLGLGGGTAFGVARFLPNGSLDSSFGTGGVAQATLGSVGGQVAAGPTTRGLALQPNGQIVVVGDIGSLSGQVVDVGVARFNANGSVDKGFGTGGVATTPVFAPSAGFGAQTTGTVLVQPNGEILVGTSALQVSYRSSLTTGAVLRYTANGSLDPSFGNGGMVVSTRLSAVGTLGVDASADVFVLPAAVELSPTGQLDASVTAAPIVSSSVGGTDAFLPDGRYVAAQSVGVGKHNVEVRAQRFAAVGTVDSTFVSPLLHFVGTSASTDSAGAIAIAPNGQIVYGGSRFFATSVFGVVRVNANGSVDTAFGTGGTLTTSFQGNESVGALVVQPNGAVIAVGYSENNATGEVDVAIARYLG
jgi:uncharacterized delta-60 repeat protein